MCVALCYCYCVRVRALSPRASNQIEYDRFVRLQRDVYPKLDEIVSQLSRFPLQNSAQNVRTCTILRLCRDVTRGNGSAQRAIVDYINTHARDNNGKYYLE